MEFDVLWNVKTMYLRLMLDDVALAGQMCHTWVLKTRCVVVSEFTSFESAPNFERHFHVCLFWHDITLALGEHAFTSLATVAEVW